MLFKDVLGSVCRSVWDGDRSEVKSRKGKGWERLERVSYGGTFSLTVVSCVPQGDKIMEYKVCLEEEAQYACHKTTFDGKENRAFVQHTGRWPVLLEYRSHHVEPDKWFTTQNLTRVQLRLRRARAGHMLTLEHIAVLRREAEWNVLWKARRGTVWRAQYWIFKGKSRDFRFVLFKEVIEEGWYAEAH